MELAMDISKEKGHQVIDRECESDFRFSSEERREAFLLTLLALEQEVASEDPVI